MSEEAKQPEETVETTAGAPAQEQPEQPQQKSMNLNDLKTGYYVGMTEEGFFVFNVFGKQQGLLELLGVHKHATECVDAAYEKSQTRGDALTHEVGKAVGMINQKFDRLMAILAPPKPDNEL